MDELKILQKTYDMILYGNQCLQQFPRSERYSLAADIKHAMYSFLRLVITANKRYHKKTTLQDMDIELDVLRTYLRLAADPNTKLLPLRKYEIWSKQLTEIGKMLGGWIKSTNS
jgi:four helix bundle protein